MPPRSKQLLRLFAYWAAILAAGPLVGWFAWRSREDAKLEQLASDARRSALAVPADLVAKFAGNRGDLDQPHYAALKEQLRRLKSVDPDVRFVYVFRCAADGSKAMFLGDSAERGAKDESQPGDDYPQAKESPGLQLIVQTGQPATEGPLADDFGTWITGYAAIEHWHTGTPPTAPRHVLGVDIDASGWRADLFAAGLQGALITWFLLGIPLAAWRVMRRERERNEVIRNLSEAMEQAHSAIMIVDLESRIEYANRGLCQQIGYSRRELIGRKWRDFQVAETAEATLADLVATVRAGRPWEGEWFNRRKSGDTYPVRGVVTPVRGRDGHLACFVTVFDDVTETKRREAELRDAIEAARAGDRAKSQFLATMSHEVRTPLNGIVGFASLLLDTSLSSEQREYVQTIRMSTETLIQLTGDILDFARIESGRLKLNPAACDPRECIEDALDLVATKAFEKDLQLLHRVADDVPGTVVADGGRLRQVLVNLAGNAVKFTERGEVEIAVRRVDGGGPGECTLEFAVRDTGIGIEPEHHGKLFRAFSQVDESTTRRYGGTGLGLAISRNLVELMGGTIGLESRAGQGATFTFTIRAPVGAPDLPPCRLEGRRLGLAMRPGALRRELAALLRSWGAGAVEGESAEEFDPAEVDAVVVEVDARMLENPEAVNLPLPPERSIALVPISLPNDLRTRLRTRFRLLVNKPLHHRALHALLTGTGSAFAANGAVAQLGLHVLVAEDNPVNRRLITRVLERFGCRSTVARNGREALDTVRARAAEFDVMLLDLHMPEADGLTVLKAIRGGEAGEAACTLPIVALTADAREEQRLQGLEAGLDGYLTKPLELGALDTVLRRVRAARDRRDAAR